MTDKFECRSCKNTKVIPILSLGSTPLANSLLSEHELDKDEELFPLDLVFCPGCSLVQITETVSPEKLFNNYLYFSSFSDTTLKSAKELAKRMIWTRDLNGNSTVVEIASNDGYLLKNYKEKGIEILGIEPAINIAEKASENGIHTVPQFFDNNLAEELSDWGWQADVIHANNVLAHVSDLHGVVEGIRTLLKPDGVAIIENHYVRDLIDYVQFDAIYHEHLCYYSLTSFRNLFAQHGLTLVDVERIPVQGGSLRVYFQRSDGPRSMEKVGKKIVGSIFQEETELGIDNISFYHGFETKIKRLRNDIIELLDSLHKTIVVYGASAKSTTFLSYLGIGAEIIDYVVDDSTAKQGKYTPGTHLPIYASDKLLETQPDYVLLLAWNMKYEILKKSDEYRNRGGKFIIPIPELGIV